jgi:ribose-phosphate pyrophosphokinase
VNTGIISNDGERRLVLISGRAHPDLAVAVSESLGSTLIPTTAYDFANGEIYVRFGESIRGADAFVLQSHAAPINQWIMEQLLMVDALKRASAKTITVVAPFYGYARQDKKHRGREPISARLMADLFKTAGADRLMSVDLHAAQIQGFFDGPVDHLWAMPLLVEYVRTRVDTSNVTVVSPDAGRTRVAEQWAAKLGGGPLAFIHKTRDISRPNRTVANRVVGDVEGRSCVLVDDLIDTAGTITGAVRVLMEAGAKDVIVAATHGVLSDPAVDRLMQCGAREVVVTDTLPIAEDRRFPQLTVLSIAPLLARAIREVFDDGSVTSLFDGQACARGSPPAGGEPPRLGMSAAAGKIVRLPRRGTSDGQDCGSSADRTGPPTP